MEREDLKLKLRAKLSVNSLKRLPKDKQEERIEKMKNQITKAMMNSK